MLAHSPVEKRSCLVTLLLNVEDTFFCRQWFLSSVSAGTEFGEHLGLREARHLTLSGQNEKAEIIGVKIVHLVHSIVAARVREPINEFYYFLVQFAHLLILSRDRHAAVDVQLNSVDETSRVRSKEEGGVC